MDSSPSLNKDLYTVHVLTPNIKKVIVVYSWDFGEYTHDFLLHFISNGSKAALGVSLGD